MNFYFGPSQPSQASLPQRPRVQSSDSGARAPRAQNVHLRAVAFGTSLLCHAHLRRCRVAFQEKRTPCQITRSSQSPVEWEEEEDIAWEHEDMIWRQHRDSIAKLCFADGEPDHLDIVAFITAILPGYFRAATMSQVTMLLASWIREQGGQLRLRDGGNDDFAQCLEEPLCWRSIPNDAGIDAFAADLITWVPEVVGEKEKWKVAKTAKGTRKMGRGFETTTTAKHDSEVTRLTWTSLKLVMHHFNLIDGNEPSLLLPEDIVLAFKKMGVKDPGDELGCEVCTYSGHPTWAQLMTTEKSMVIVFLESPVSPDLFWSLPAEPPSSARRSDSLTAAPVLLLSLQQAEVKFNVAGLLQKLRRWLSDDKNLSPEADLSDDLSDLFGQLKGILTQSVPWAFRAEHLRSKLGALMRKAFANRRAKLRELRLPELDSAHKEMANQLERRRELKEKEERTIAGLMEAIRERDADAYEKQLASAKSGNLLSVETLQSLEVRWADVLKAAEAELQTLVENCIVSDLDQALLVLPKIRKELQSSMLPKSSIWFQVADELQGTLEAFQELQYAAAAFESSSSSSVKPGDSQKLFEDLEIAEKHVQDFELALSRTKKQTHASLWIQQPPVRKPFQPLLQRCRQIQQDSSNDKDFEQVLKAVPWMKGKRLFAGITSDERDRLEAAAEAATEACRKRNSGALEEALSLAGVAERLRGAMKGKDEVLLQEILKEAKEYGFSGLDSIEQTCYDLRTAKLNLRSELSQKVFSLDLAAFELCARRSSEVGLCLPNEEMQELREELLSSIQKEEEEVQELMTSTVELADTALRDLLTKCMTKCRLRETNPWRRVAEDSLRACEAGEDIRESLASTPIDETKLQANLTAGGLASKHLKVSLEQAKQLSKGAEVNAFAFCALQKALDEGYLGLAGAQADEALDALLSSSLWQEPTWEAIQPSDLRELEVRVQEATNGGQQRLATQMQRALEVGRCAVDLANAMRQSNINTLQQAYSKALELDLQGLEKVEQRISSRRARTSTVVLQRPNAAVIRNLDKQQQSCHPNRLQRPEDHMQLFSAGGYENQAARSRCTHMIFCDLELTAGFYDFEDEPRILEVAIIVTDQNLKELGRGHWVLGGFSRQELESLGDFHKDNFRDSDPGGDFPPLENQISGNGLFSDVLKSRLSLEEVESEIMELVTRHCPVGECPLVGYSVQCDREVLKDQMPRFYRHLSHQIVDVSGFFTIGKMWIDGWCERRSTGYNHRALNDVEDAIEAMGWLRKNLFPPSMVRRAKLAKHFWRVLPNKLGS
ncbi:Oligoribonuclease [Durusdinium trenchii]|uniref:Oligoribonuclease n=1 Tax=Durusdinium trenchii TaxID=1381693 RepID=A0ABP0H604_9DINO